MILNSWSKTTIILNQPNNTKLTEKKLAVFSLRSRTRIIPLTLPNFMCYYKATVIKIAWY